MSFTQTNIGNYWLHCEVMVLPLLMLKLIRHLGKLHWVIISFEFE